MPKPLPGPRASILGYFTRSSFDRIDYSDRLLADWQGSFGGSIFGIAGGDSGGGVALPQPPVLVLNEYSDTLNRAVVSIGLGDAVDYLIASGVSPMLERNLPEARMAIEQICSILETTPGELVETVLQLGSGADMSRTTLYISWRDWLRDVIDEQVPQERRPIRPRGRNRAALRGRGHLIG